MARNRVMNCHSQDISEYKPPSSHPPTLPGTMAQLSRTRRSGYPCGASLDKTIMASLDARHGNSRQRRHRGARSRGRFSSSGVLDLRARGITFCRAALKWFLTSRVCKGREITFRANDRSSKRAVVMVHRYFAFATADKKKPYTEWNGSVAVKKERMINCTNILYITRPCMTRRSHFSSIWKAAVDR